VCLVGNLVTRWANFGRPDPMMLFQPVTLLTSRTESRQPFLLELVKNLLRIHSVDLLLFLADGFNGSFLYD